MKRMWVMVKPLRQTTRVMRNDVICHPQYSPEGVFRSGIKDAQSAVGYIVVGISGYPWSHIVHRPDQRLYRAQVIEGTPDRVPVPMNEIFSQPLNLP